MYFWKENFGDPDLLSQQMDVNDARLIFWWINYLTGGEKVFTKESAQFWCEVLINSRFFDADNHKYGCKYKTDKCIVYDSQRFQLIRISSLDKYIEEINNLENNKDITDKCFFRGHSTLNYQLLPSVMRENRNNRVPNLLRCENDLYNEILYKCADEFKECKSHIELLTIMQHYGLPTRLLDITTNPLVALFFSCCGNDSLLGEVCLLQTSEEMIKWPNSDLVSLLATLPTLTYDNIKSLSEALGDYRANSQDAFDLRNKKFNSTISVKKLVREIISEKSGFTPDVSPEDLFKNVFVYAARNNPRVINQSGAFILFGGPYIEEHLFGGYLRTTFHFITPANEYRFKYKNGITPLFVVQNKRKILDELARFDISSEKLFPEIEKVACEIKGKYLNND